MKQYIKLKDENEMLDILFIHPILLLVFADFNIYAFQRQLPVTITRIVDEKIPNVSTSDTHAEGRAIDLSVNGWTQKDIDKIASILNLKYGLIYGTSKNGKNPRVCVVHKGTAMHFHLQVRRGL